MRFALALAQAMWVQATQTPWQTEVEEPWPAAGHRQSPGRWRQAGGEGGSEPCFGVRWRFWVPLLQSPAVLRRLPWPGRGERDVGWGEGSWEQFEPRDIKILIMRQAGAGAGRGAALPRCWDRVGDTHGVPIMPGASSEGPFPLLHRSFWGERRARPRGRRVAGGCQLWWEQPCLSREPLEPPRGASARCQPHWGRRGAGWDAGQG